MWKKMKNKLTARCGESMTEALAACLIIAVSISMLAGVMVSSANTIQKSRQIQENNDKIMQKFWDTTVEDKDKGDDKGELGNLKGPISTDIMIPVNLYAKEVEEGNGLKGTVYEFIPRTSTTG